MFSGSQKASSFVKHLKKRASFFEKLASFLHTVVNEKVSSLWKLAGFLVKWSPADVVELDYMVHMKVLVQNYHISPLVAIRRSGPWFNIKMLSYQYRKSHCGDKTVVRSSYLHNGISYTGEMSSLYWIGSLIVNAPCLLGWISLYQFLHCHWPQTLIYMIHM